ncbi:sulfurtransferase-like selenium metabolism protein YedF [Senegalia massiliensis]|uniref:Sulfurtransferase-like selenium metabolism protein YedF n=1 Tax=Senegalia massiliensis TaxID=1720316 RepID=A0A845QZE6_9CLOT|nr:sulfurtransferase-like selenium metabolism protein YedF [Senegalia massiliensis]
MVKEIDAREQACPKPVIMTKKALESMDKGEIDVIVDNEVAKENVSKLSKSMNLEYSVSRDNENFIINIVKGEKEEVKEKEDIDICKPNLFKDTTIAINSDKMGEGNDELGKILIKGFIYSLTESLPYPSTLVFYNNGVKLTVEGSECLEDLKTLEEAGVEILSCGTCLDYNNIADKLSVGGVTNMYTIVEKIKNSTNTITI